MTNSPDQPIPASDSPTTTDAPPVPEPVSPVPEPVSPVPEPVSPVPEPVEGSALPATEVQLDAGTFTRIIEPRSANRLPLDGVWHQISPRYIAVQLISNGLMLLLVLGVALVLSLVLHQVWVWIPAGIVLAGIVWALAILPRQARSIGYQLRTDDLVFRRGILWQRMVAVPYGRMQLVDITHGPLDRAFGIAQLKLVTAAAATGVTIPGLSQAAAEQLRDTLIDVAETRRTGL